MSAVLIVDRYFSKCSACNGNADPSELRHIHGGPGSGYRPGSGLGDTNGCGATFTERYYVHDGRTEPIAPAALDGGQPATEEPTPEPATDVATGEPTAADRYCFCPDCIRCGCGVWEEHHADASEIVPQSAPWSLEGDRP
jgi:hypothetical protein